ncbi:helix-turn-helix domain-containing protein [Mycolicibacterium sp. HS_4_1]
MKSDQGDAEFKTYSLAEVVAMIDTGLKDPVRWLREQIRSGRVTARKIGRDYRMTRSDIRELLDGCKNPRPPAKPVVELPEVPTLTSVSPRRLRKRD